MSTTKEQLKDEGTRLQVVMAGATAGMIARFFIAPLDVVKIRLQLQTHSLSDPLTLRNLRGGPIYKGIVPTMRHILAREGLTALWKGNVPAELLYICYSAVQFTTYRSTTQLLRSLQGSGDGGPRPLLPSAAESFVAGGAAGTLATAVTYPLDLLRTRFAAQGHDDRVYASLRRAVADIWRDEGPRGFFRGVGPGVAQTLPFMGIFFAVYESLRAPLADLRLPFWDGQLALASVAASTVAKTGVFPLDLVRKRIQVQGPTRQRYVHKNIPEYRGTLSTVRVILHTEGVRGLYRGLTVSLLKAAPASAITMWTYERVLKALILFDEARREKVL